MKSFQNIFTSLNFKYLKGGQSMGILELVQILMIILKLCNVLPFAWPWVFAPLGLWVILKLLGKY
jgi:hypothetical protein